VVPPVQENVIALFKAATVTNRLIECLALLLNKLSDSWTYQFSIAITVPRASASGFLLSWPLADARGTVTIPGRKK